jgi:hypothetical protein
VSSKHASRDETEVPVFTSGCTAALTHLAAKATTAKVADWLRRLAADDGGDANEKAAAAGNDGRRRRQACDTASQPGNAHSERRRCRVY